MSSPRRLAMDSLEKIIFQTAYSNLVIHQTIKANEMEPRDKAFYTRMVYGVLENKYRLDHILAAASTRKLHKLPNKILIILEMALYQLLYMDGVAEFAAVDESVKMARKIDPGSAGYVNGLLRNYLRNPAQPKPYASEKHRISVEYSVSQSMVQALCDDYGMEEVERMLQAMRSRRDLHLRVNTLKTSASDLAVHLEKDGLHPITMEPFTSVLAVKNFSDIDQNEAFQNGLFSIEDASSVLAVQALAPRREQSVRDVCACPGGKTTCMAEMMKNAGHIDACDLSESKLPLIDSACKRLGITIVRTKVYDATQVETESVGSYDKVLVDAPCSGTGVLGKKPEIGYKEMEQIDRFPELQFQILCSASEYLNDLGEMVYSTCSLLKRENEEVVRRFLETMPDFELVAFETEAGRCESGILPLLPSRTDMDGFFISKLRRKPVAHLVQDANG